MAEFADMKLFVHAVTAGSLSAAGRELGFTPAVGSKRLARLEQELGTRLVQRSSRHFALTEEGAIYFELCQSILADVANAEAAVGRGSQQPQGTLRVSAPVVLGRRWIGPALAQFAMDYPDMKVQLLLSDAYVDLIEGGFDCAVRVGGDVDARLVARKLADNRRVICAAPSYLARRGRPQRLEDLARHDCIVMNSTGLHADWRLHRCDAKPAKEQVVRVHGRMVANTGEQAHDWALAGLGLVRRSVWDVAEDLAQGRLEQVLSDWCSDEVPVRVVFSSRRFLPARTRVFIDRLVALFAGEPPVMNL
jgi:DNA-binding transcriptional LysR family regulator